VLLGTVQFHIRLVRGVFRFLDKVSSEHLKKVTTKCRIEVEVNGRRTGKEKMRQGGGRAGSELDLYLESIFTVVCGAT
jgi:hypothetical protein